MSSARKANNDDPRLSRIRENQRRSRARKREYMEDLERRWQKCKELGVQANVELQQAARKVIEENVLLRAVLSEAGISQDEVERRLQVLKDKKGDELAASGAGSEVACEDNGCGGAGGMLVGLEEFFNEFELLPLPQGTSSAASLTGESLDLGSLGDPTGMEGSGAASSASQNLQTPDCNAGILEDFPNLDELDTSEFLENLDLPQSLDWPLPDHSSSPAPPEPPTPVVPTPEQKRLEPEGTTNCMEAYRLLKTLNERRPELRDMFEIVLELWNSFCLPEPGGNGCRLDSEALRRAIESLKSILKN
ncbi:unnamed protein product [Tuber aestivum]|uniref:BZIP domain-containing protein n=1 Tax=Tuber aestivum TaxID=59557 RepID=A0A292PQ36_9PEZI|nr:unnamed protein product [Tuber aestivum]